jgi:hypothetical protein
VTATIHAGVRFVTEASLIEADDSEFSDLEVTVEWVPPDSSGYGDPIAAPERTYLWVDSDEHRMWLPMLKDTDIMRSWQLRQAAPVVAACFDRLTIHAGAVAIDDKVIAFCGASGVGKSSLAWALVKSGAQPISDDLLPIRFNDSPYVPHGDAQLPLESVLFLSRGSSGPDTSTLDDSAALQRHVENGFGEHHESAVWAFQFDAYHRLATGALHEDLVIPDDRSRLPEVAEWLTTHMQPAGESR